MNRRKMYLRLAENALEGISPWEDAEYDAFTWRVLSEEERPLRIAYWTIGTDCFFAELSPEEKCLFLLFIMEANCND